jgi:hypothetical protein
MYTRADQHVWHASSLRSLVIQTSFFLCSALKTECNQDCVKVAGMNCRKGVSGRGRTSRQQKQHRCQRQLQAFRYIFAPWILANAMREKRSRSRLVSCLTGPTIELSQRSWRSSLQSRRLQVRSSKNDDGFSEWFRSMFH